MADLAGALKETPLPTIFVLAGIVFWLLAIAGSIAGKVTVLPGQQRTAAVVGTLFVFLGMGLYLVPGRGNDRASVRTEAVSTSSVQQTAPAATTALLTASVTDAKNQVYSRQSCPQRKPRCHHAGQCGGQSSPDRSGYLRESQQG